MNLNIDAREKLEKFNKNFKKNAVFFLCRSFWPDIDGDAIEFYELIEDINPVDGFYLIKQVGNFNYGHYFENHNTTESGFICSNNSSIYVRDSIRKGFPLSKNNIHIDSPTVRFKSGRYDLYSFLICKSCIPINRYWIEDIEDISDKDSELSFEISLMINQVIGHLADIQVKNDFKSSWVYYRFLEKRQGLNKLINGDMLRNTEFFYDSLIHYNRFSSSFVELSAKEREEVFMNDLYE